MKKLQTKFFRNNFSPLSQTNNCSHNMINENCVIINFDHVVGKNKLAGTCLDIKFFAINKNVFKKRMKEKFQVEYYPKNGRKIMLNLRPKNVGLSIPNISNNFLLKQTNREKLPIPMRGEYELDRRVQFLEFTMISCLLAKQRAISNILRNKLLVETNSKLYQCHINPWIF